MNGSAPAPRPRRRIVATYDYTDESGDLLFQEVRYQPKDFSQRRPDGRGGWIGEIKGVRRVPYRLPDLIAADPTELVYITEGPKDADRLLDAGLVATTNPMGAKKWRSEYNEPFRDRQIIVLTDNDGDGRENVQIVARSLYGTVASIKLLEFPDLPEHDDVSDWLDAGHTIEELKAVAASAPEWEPAAATEQADADLPILPNTDAGNAELFARLHGDGVRFDHRRQRYLAWAGHWWADDPDGEVHRLAKATVRQRGLEALTTIEDIDQRAKAVKFAIGSESRQRLDALLALAKHEQPIADAGENWDADPWLLGVANGVVDLKTGRLRDGRPQDRITLHSDVAFDSEATCPRWERFLDEVFDGNAELIDFIQVAVGYSLTGDTREQCHFHANGPGSNGKDVFLTPLRRIAGSYAYNAPFSMFEKERRSGSRRTVESYNRMIQHFFRRLGKPPDKVKSQEVFAWAHGSA